MSAFRVKTVCTDSAGHFRRVGVRTTSTINIVGHPRTVLRSMLTDHIFVFGDHIRCAVRPGRAGPSAAARREDWCETVFLVLDQRLHAMASLGRAARAQATVARPD